MKSPITSITDDQLAEIEKEFGRNSPCPHHNIESIGFGHYHRCHDCGCDVPSEMLERAKAASDRHDEIQVILRDAFARLRAAEADAKRYRTWTGLMFVEPSKIAKALATCETPSEIDAALDSMERKA